MRFAIVTDIHEDIAGLEKNLNTLNKAGYDLLVCLGDITGFTSDHYTHWPDANACIDLLKEKADIVLAGNHDLFTCQKLSSYQEEKKLPLNWYELSIQEKKAISKGKFWLYENETVPELSPENLNYLIHLPNFHCFNIKGDPILFSHFVMPDMAGTVTWMPDRIWQLRDHFNYLKQSNVKLSFVGHFHPDKTTVAGRFFKNASGIKPYKIKASPAIVLCPAVADKGNSGCIIFDSDTWEITTLSVG
jgi:predicted phosphodiesterase